MLNVGLVAPVTLDVVQATRYLRTFMSSGWPTRPCRLNRVSQVRFLPGHGLDLRRCRVAVRPIIGEQRH